MRVGGVERLVAGHGERGFPCVPFGIGRQRAVQRHRFGTIAQIGTLCRVHALCDKGIARRIGQIGGAGRLHPV